MAPKTGTLRMCLSMKCLPWSVAAQARMAQPVAKRVRKTMAPTGPRAVLDMSIRNWV
ncbi:hypothetical protein D3C86_2046870 [compost metagenome]